MVPIFSEHKSRSQWLLCSPSLPTNPLMSNQPTLSPNNFKQAVDDTHSVFLLSQPAWINFQNIYKSLELMPTDKGYFADSNLTEPFQLVDQEGAQFENNYKQIVDMANDFATYGENMIGHLDTLIQAKTMLASGNEQQKQFGQFTLDHLITSVQTSNEAHLLSIKKAEAWLEMILGLNATNQPIIQQLKDQYDQELAKDNQDLKAAHDAWLEQRKNFLDANEEFAKAWSATLKATFFGVVDTGILVGEIAAEDVSPDSVKKVLEDGIEWIKDVVDLFSAEAAAEKAMSKIQELSKQIMAEIEKKGEDKLAALFLGMALQNLERVPKIVDAAFQALELYRSAWMDHQAFWNQPSEQILATSLTAIQSTQEAWHELIQEADSFAEVGLVNYEPRS